MRVGFVSRAKGGAARRLRSRFSPLLLLPALTLGGCTLLGTLHYSGERVAMGSMVYKQQNLIYDLAGGHPTSTDAILKKMGKTQINLKLIPSVDGRLEIAQLVGYNLADITVKGAWSGPARLHLIPHVNAPVADLPVRKVLGGLHFIADLTLPFGRVLHDYLKELGEDAREEAAPSKARPKGKG